MKLTEILSPDRVVCGLPASSKKKAIEELSRLLADGHSELGYDLVFSSLTCREKLGATGVGHGVAIPHGKVSGVEHSVAAFVRLQAAVDYDSNDAEPVDLLFGLIAPESANGVHRDQVSAIAEMLSDPENCQKLRDAESSSDLHHLIVSLEHKEEAPSADQ